MIVERVGADWWRFFAEGVLAGTSRAPTGRTAATIEMKFSEDPREGFRKLRCEEEAAVWFCLASALIFAENKGGRRRGVPERTGSSNSV